MPMLNRQRTNFIANDIYTTIFLIVMDLYYCYGYPGEMIQIYFERRVLPKELRHSTHHPPIKQHKMQHISHPQRTTSHSRSSPTGSQKEPLSHPEQATCVPNPVSRKVTANAQTAIEEGRVEYVIKRVGNSASFCPCFRVKLLNNQHGENENCGSDAKNIRRCRVTHGGVGAVGPKLSATRVLSWNVAPKIAAASPKIDRKKPERRPEPSLGVDRSKVAMTMSSLLAEPGRYIFMPG
jgi:hypothetical protein